MTDEEQQYKFYRIVKTSEIPEGERLMFEIENQDIVLFHVNGELLATGDICTHDGGAIGDGELDGDVIICPRHGARFDIHTGKALSLPAVIGIPVYPVRIVEDFVEVGVPEN